MANKIETLISVAKEELGYMEKSNARLPDLYDKTKNAGNKNYTKYAQDLFPKLQGQPWCAMYTCWSFTKAFTLPEAKRLLCGEFSAYTPTFAQNFKNKGQWFTTNPKVGDVIFFKNTQRICHVGIVIGVNSTTVTTIEGNTSSKSGVIPNGGMVCQKTYTINNSRIAGYGRPKYDVTSEPVKSNNPTSKIGIVYNCTQLNFRDANSTKGKILAKLSKNEKVLILEESDGWYKCQYNGKIGYCSAKYIRVD